MKIERIKKVQSWIFEAYESGASSDEDIFRYLRNYDRNITREEVRALAIMALGPQDHVEQAKVRYH